MIFNESVFKKIKNVNPKDFDVVADDSIKNIDMPMFWKILVQRLKNANVKGVEKIGNTRTTEIFSEDELREYANQVVYFFIHDENYRTADFRILSIFERKIDEEEVFDEEKWGELKKEGMNFSRIGYWGIHVYDYAVFGASPEESDMDVQINLVSTNNIRCRSEEWDSYGYDVKLFTENENLKFVTEDNWQGWSFPHFRISKSLLNQLTRKCVWIDTYGNLFNKFVKEQCGYYNGENLLEEIGEYLTAEKKVRLRQNVNESLVRKIKNTKSKDFEKRAEEVITKIDNYNEFVTLLYQKMLKNGFVPLNGHFFGLDEKVSGNYLKPFADLSLSNEKSPSVSFFRIVEIPIDFLISEFPSSKSYYFDQETNTQIRGDVAVLEFEIRPIFQTSYGYCEWKYDSESIVGFRIYFRYEVDCWELGKQGNRYFKTEHQHFSHDFRFIPDAKKGFKMLLGDKNASDREKIWQIDYKTFLIVEKIIRSIFNSIDNGSFRKEFFEKLYSYEKGVKYTEYISSPKMFKDFIGPQSKIRLEYLKKYDREGRMFTEVPKLERYLFTEIVDKGLNGQMNESLVRKIKNTKSKDFEKRAEDVFNKCSPKEAFFSILGKLESDSRFNLMTQEKFQEMCTLFGRYGLRNNSQEEISKYKSFLKSNKFYYSVRQNFDENMPFFYILISKPCFINGEAMISTLTIRHSINSKSEIQKRKISFSIDMKGRDFSFATFFKNEGSRLVATATGKGLDYEVDTTYENSNLIFNAICNILTKSKSLLTYLSMNAKYDVLKSDIELNGLGKRPRLKKQQKIEKQQELEIFAEQIRKKFRMKKNAPIPYLTFDDFRKLVSKYI